MDSEKCWRPRLRKISALAGLIVLALAALPAAAETEPPALAKLKAFLETIDTLTAEFEQTDYDADQTLIEESSGSFALERPGHFVWRYRTPYEQVVLADGERLWMYDVELEQATVSPLEEDAGSPAMLLSGRASVLEAFDVESTSTSGGLDRVRLVPKQSDTDFQLVAIGFDADGLPRELEFVNGLNQTTRIEFSRLAVNEPLDDGVFGLDLPDDVDVIGTED